MRHDREPNPNGNHRGETADAHAAPGDDNALTIPSGRLAGNAACLNCGTRLEGPFCYYCGQPDKNIMRFFPALMREFMADFIELDSRFIRTMGPLLFLPGKLTRDYLDGRRFRYTPPLRLYIFSSMAFFILAAMLTGSGIVIESSETVPEGGHATRIHSGIDAGEIEEIQEAVREVSPALAERIRQKASEAREEAGSPQSTDPADSDAGHGDGSTGFQFQIEDDGNDDKISINGKPWDRDTNPLIIPLMPNFFNDWINDEIEQSPQKGREIEANPNLIVDKIFDVLPATMFVLLPIVALLFKLWYLFADKYYVEHLILALHNHSFLFVALLLSLVLNALAGWLEPSQEGPVTRMVFWINLVIVLWIPVYFLLSLKRVYQQGWGMTVAKYMVIGMSYLILLALATPFVAVLSFVLL